MEKSVQHNFFIFPPQRFIATSLYYKGTFILNLVPVVFIQFQSIFSIKTSCFSVKASSVPPLVMVGVARKQRLTNMDETVTKCDSSQMFPNLLNITTGPRLSGRNLMLPPEQESEMPNMLIPRWSQAFQVLYHILPYHRVKHRTVEVWKTALRCRPALDTSSVSVSSIAGHLGLSGKAKLHLA